MQVTYRVHSVTEFDGTETRELTLTLVTPGDLIGPPKSDHDHDPEWDDAFDRAEEAIGEADITFVARDGGVGMHGGVEARTTNPDIKRGQLLRFTVEIVDRAGLKTGV